MPSIIETLTLENQTLVTVTENDSAQHALSLMIEQDFSQLPVVDDHQKLKGMVTSDSILRAVSYFKVIPEKLKVSHAIIVKAKAHRDEEDLSELLRGLRDTSAIPIVDGTRKVIAIVTNYDTAEYFRHRAADLMLAKDIELILRDLILSASASDADAADNDAMTQFIQSAMPSDREQKNKFKNALMSYVNQIGDKKHTPNASLLDSVFAQHLKESAPQKKFKKLTLSELIRIVQKLWDTTYRADFKDMSWEVIGPLLDDVRKTRNAIAHFDEVTDQQRKRLQFCADFLGNHRPTAGAAETIPIASDVQSEQNNISESSAEPANFNPPEEEIEANDSRYARLAIWLQEREPDRVTRTFKEIEGIIEDELPASARQHRNWWANDAVSHTQAIQWLEVGWRVSSVNMSTERVVFSRMGDRQSAYIDFFNQLQAKLQSIEGLSIKPLTNQQGRHWLVLAIGPENDGSCKPPHIIFTFARRSRFRIETYINEREQKQNKQIFDQLLTQKPEIETEFGAALSWERLNHRHGSRIAYYRPGSSITDSAEALDNIQTWAIEMLPMFYASLSDRFIAAQKEFADEGEG